MYMNNQDNPGGGTSGAPPVETAEWKEIVRKYQEPSIAGSVWQLVNTLGPYVALWIAMYFALSVSYWLVVPLAILAGAFLVRTFIIFHDCTHGSFFKSRRANDIVGFITGVLVFTRAITGGGNTRCTIPAPATSTGAASAMCGRSRCRNT